MLAIKHAKEHFWPSQHKEVEEHPSSPHPSSVELSAEAKQHLLQASQSHFETAIKQSSTKLQHDLENTNNQINDLVRKMATEVVSSELERYKADLDKLKNQAEEDINGIQSGIAKHRDEIKAKIDQEIENEKQQLINQINTKLSDAVSSFLLETLQHNVDLGSQSAYLVKMLDEHKADFIKEVNGDENRLK